MKNKVIIDTDPGHDDAMAILMILAASNVEVQAITTVAGNSGIQNVTNNAYFVRQLARREDIPIFSGASRPLVRESVLAVVHGESGLDGAVVNVQAKLDAKAVEKIIEIVDCSPGEVSLLVLGPQTNIAQAIQQAPDAMRKLKQLVIMGGAFTVSGNKNAVAEFNICVDPEAAAIVAAFEVPKVYVPLDVCNAIQVPLSKFEAITPATIRDALVAMMRPYIHNLNFDELETKGALMYDVLAAYVLLFPEKCLTEKARVQVETKGELTYGMTLVDRRLSQRDALPNAEIVTSISQEDFEMVFFDALNSFDES